MPVHQILFSTTIGAKISTILMTQYRGPNSWQKVTALFARLVAIKHLPTSPLAPSAQHEGSLSPMTIVGWKITISQQSCQ